jgi:AraC-like DNA-binding protein
METKNQAYGIPDIKFRKKKNDIVGFEIMPLADLFARYKDGLIEFDIQSFHRPQFNTIIFIREGTGTHFIDFRTINYKSGDLICISQNQVHAFKISDNTEALMILFTTEFIMHGMIHQEVRSINNLIRNMLKTPLLRRKDAIDTIQSLFHTLAVEYCDDPDKNKFGLFRHLLAALITKISGTQGELSKDKAGVGWQKTLDSFDKDIEDTLYRCRDAGEYAKTLRCSYKHLNEICKSLTGRTAKQYIDSAITLEIKRYLATTDLNIRELSDVFNFDEDTNFVKYFKKHSGMSPKRFREQLLK